MRMKWNLCWRHDNPPKNIQDERCPPPATHQGSSESDIHVCVLDSLLGAAEVLELRAKVACYNKLLIIFFKLWPQ